MKGRNEIRKKTQASKEMNMKEKKKRMNSFKTKLFRRAN